MREDSDCADVYNRMVVMSLIFANQYISQKQLSGKITGKQFSLDRIREIHEKIGAILDAGTDSQ